jgi:beta-N-acetylhexosaminidase
MAIGATYNEHKTQFSTAINRVIAEQLLSLGINVNFAPSVDVNINPLNPVINVRSYGSSAGKVAELGIAAVEALQTTGVISAMKHFPGHGDTHVDSHTGLPIVAHTRNQIDAIDVFPFAQAIDAGGRASPAMIMTAHIQYPELDAKQFIANDGKSTIVPATLSRKILTDVLRNELNYQGLIVTDALDMAGIAHYMDESQAMLQTFYAGADIALMPYAIRNPNDISEYQRLLDEVTATILTQADKTTAAIPSIDEMRASTVRILATKKKYLDQASANLDDTLSNKERSVIAADQLEIGLAKAALTSVLGPTKMDLQKSQVVGLVMPDNARCEAFVFAMQQQDFEQVRCLSLAKSSPNKQLIQFVDNIDILIIGDISPQHSIAEMGGMDDLVSGRERAGKQQQYSHIQVLLETAKWHDKQRVFVALRTPYIIERFKALIDAAVVTYDYRVSIDKKTVRGVMFDVLAEWLAGEFEAKGQLPVTIGAAKQGHSTQQLD